jgi:hypothetical protein
MLELIDRIREHVAYQTREHYPRQTGSRVFSTALLMPRLAGCLGCLDALDATAYVEDPLPRNGKGIPTPSNDLGAAWG